MDRSDGAHIGISEEGIQRVVALRSAGPQEFEPTAYREPHLLDLLQGVANYLDNNHISPRAIHFIRTPEDGEWEARIESYTYKEESLLR